MRLYTLSGKLYMQARRRVQLSGVRVFSDIAAPPTGRKASVDETRSSSRLEHATDMNREQYKHATRGKSGLQKAWQHVPMS